MDISLAETQEDIQSVYAKHALYHLTQENASQHNHKPTLTDTVDHTEEYLVIDKTQGITGNKNGNSFESSTQICDVSSTDKRGRQTFEEFGNESSSFTLFNLAEKSNSMPYNKSPTKNVFPLESIYDKTVHTVEDIPAITQNKDEIQPYAINDNEIQSKTTDVHPIELTKSVNSCDKPARIPGIANVKVIDLMDSTSINQLKRLWEKPSNVSKRSKVVSTQTPLKRKRGRPRKNENVDNRKVLKGKDSWSLNKNVKSPVSLKFKVKNTSYEKSPQSKYWQVDYLKPCSIKIKKVEAMNFTSSNLRVDLTVPKTPDKKTKYIYCTPKTLSKNTVKKVTEHVANTYGVKSKTAKKSITSFVMKSISDITKLNLNRITECENKTKGKMPQESDAITLTANGDLFKVKEEAGSIDGKKSTNRVETALIDNSNETLLPEELDLFEDSGDDYLPSEDEYKPFTKDNLKNAFTKPKKRKKIKSMQNLQFERKNKHILGKRLEEIRGSQTDIAHEDADKVSEKPKRRYVRKNIGTTRIGRPPVLGYFECKHCSFTADEKNLVEKHAKIHKRPTLKCRFCEATFKAQNPLWEHEARKHTNENPFKCSFEGCDYASKCKTDLNHHQSKHATDKKYVCGICDWATKWRRNLRSHHLMRHSNERKYKCPECPFEAKRGSDLKQHIFRHTSEKPIQCLQCGFLVKTNWELRSHMLSHSTEKPFACSHPGCTARTKTNADLMKHMRVHLTERKFTCETCSKSFKCQNSLKKHYSIHESTRKFGCDICGKRFKSKSAMRKHLSLHSGIKPHKCPVCNMAFAVSNNLKSHMVTHDTTNRPYLCPLCPHAAKQQDHLLAHIGTFHGKSYTYFCEICRKPFGRYGQLKFHYKRMHSRVDMNSIGQLGLNMLRADIKSELEENSEALRKEIHHDSSTTKYDNIKTETVVEEIPDLRLNEATGELEYIGNESTNISVSGIIPSLSGSTGENLYDTISNANNMKTEDENTETTKTQCSSLNGSDNKDAAKNGKNPDVSAITQQQHVVCSSSTAKVAMYDGFRLPLATKGFAFNYEKSGKKPKAWFMDISCMNEQDSAKQKKYLRKIGVLAPLPKGKRKKNSLTAFVNRRKRTLTNTIRKSNMLKESKLATKINSTRKARFQGNYIEFETLEGNELTEKDITKQFGQKKEDEELLETKVKKEPKKVFDMSKTKTKLVSHKKIVKEKKVVKKKPVKSKPKLLLSSEKKALARQLNKKIDIRKPSFMQGEESVTNKGVLDKPLKKAIGSSSKNSNTKGKGSRNSKSKKSETLKVSNVGRKRKLEPETEKSKYKKLYVPVKKLKQAEVNKQTDMKSKYNKKYIPVKKRKGEKEKNVSQKKSKLKSKEVIKVQKKPTKGSSPSKSPKKKLKVKITGNSSAKRSSSSNTVVNTVLPGTTSGDFILREADFFIDTTQEPPVEMKMNETDAALLNKSGGMLDKVIILKTEKGHTEYDETTNEQIYMPVICDSGISEDTTEAVGIDSGIADEDFVKSEPLASCPEDSGTVIIMEADSGEIKEEMSFGMVMKMSEGGSSVFNDSGLVVKQEPEDFIDDTTHTKSRETDE